MEEKKRKYSYGYYAVGNNAVKVYEEEEEVKPVRTQQSSSNSDSIYKKAPKRQVAMAKINRVCTFAVAFAIIATLGILVAYLGAQSNINRLNAEIDQVKKEVAKVKKENSQLERDIEEMINLDEIYVEATERLGMHLPGPNEVYYIGYEPVSYTTKYRHIEKKSEDVTVGQVLGHIFKVGE